jgi:Cd2+/Zn2+-exporting ATPase/Cu+-exporting ATPase
MRDTSETKTIEIPVKGMDCAECALHVERAVTKLPGVKSVQVLLTAEKAIVHLDPALAGFSTIRKAIEDAGYAVGNTPSSAGANFFSRQSEILLGAVFGTVMIIVIAGEWLGIFDRLNVLVPFPLGVAIVIAGGWQVFINVVRAALKKQITSHTLMTIGVIAALLVGEWVTAAIVVIFMRIGSYVEQFTTEGARRAIKELNALAPQTVRIERDGIEQEVPVSEVQTGEVVIVRPGEKIPVDGEVLDGHATVDQSSITGEAMPVEVVKGSHVFAATIAKLGSLRIKTLRVGPDTTFGRVIKMVEEAEAHRSEVQRFADRFSGYYLPLVAGIAALTFLISRNPLATAAVLVVACSCSIALATPIAMLASIGASAKRGLLIKGGKYLETLARADVVLIDKTGTLTLGQPKITDIIALNGMSTLEILTLAAAVERYSEHPLAEAVRAAAREQHLPLAEPQDFEALPGQGVRARVNGMQITIGNRHLFPQVQALPEVQQLEAQGKTLLLVTCNNKLAAILAAADTLRREVPEALKELYSLGVKHIELLTGDHERAAAALAGSLGIAYRADLLPEDKIQIVKDCQAQGKTVIMIGDGINDAPALAQANVGIAMGAVGSDIAIEVAHIALLHEDWRLIPKVLRIARRTMSVVKMNLIFTGVYNLVGLTLAGLGILPPVLAAAAQSLPDLGILANSARLLKQEKQN